MKQQREYTVRSGNCRKHLMARNSDQAAREALAEWMLAILQGATTLHIAPYLLITSGPLGEEVLLDTQQVAYRILRSAGVPKNQLVDPQPESGVCSKCGCTDMNACPGNCSWVNSDHTLCSACADDLCGLCGMQPCECD